MTTENQIELDLIAKLEQLKYTSRPDIRDRAALEANFRDKFQQLNRVKLTDDEFARLLEEIVTPDVFTAAQTLRTRNSFVREDGTPLNYTLVNIEDWCKNTFEVVNQLRISTDYSHHRYDVILLINGVPTVQIELKTLGINPRRAIEQIVEYKNDPGNGFTRTLLCFMQMFVVSNRDSTYYFANNNARHFSFNADERFLPIYQYAKPDNTKINGLDEFADAVLAKCTLGQMISRYMVLVASEQKLLMMRPYPFFVRSQNVERIDSFSYEGEAVLTSGDGVGVGENYHYINGKFDFHQRVYCIYDFKQITSGQFFFYYFSTHFKKRVKQMSAKNSVDSVRMAMITEMPVWIPLLAEQQLIAGCLASLDNQIFAGSAELVALKGYKKGLMQQLFPSLEEA